MCKFDNENGRHALKGGGLPPLHAVKTIIPGKKFPGHLIFFLTALLLLLQVSIPSHAQSPPNEALWSENGYSLKKVVSNTTIASGVNFSYTIIFSAPAGVTSVSIQDLVPASLQVVSVTAAGPVCTVTPVTNVAGNLVTYNLSSLNPLCAPSGSFTIVVKFPEGVTCNGESARNRAEILVGDKWQPTPYVSTTATAVNPWKVTKTIIGGASVNPSGGSCGYIMAPGDTITYRLAVLKDNPYFGNVTGQQNMTSAVVTDVLPTGAIFVPGSNPCVSASGSTLTWNVNCPTQLLNAAIPWAYYWTDIKIYYPAASFPVTTQVLNQATLTGVSCFQQESHTSNQTCITVVPPNPSGNFSKYISLTNRVPGCSGLYYITFCNNGNVPLSAFNINDAIPAGVTVTGITIYGANATTTVNLNINSSPYATGITGTYNSGVITTPVNNVQLQMTGSLPVNGCVYLYISFTVNPNPTGTVVTNCATFAPLANSLTLNPVCASFTVEAGTPKPCLLKDICLPQSSYNPGDIVRFRLRVQNIGSADITGASMQDVLHSNFTYVGNESYYVANSYNVGCSTGSTLPSGASAWTGVSPSHSGNNLSWTLPNVPADCQLFYSAWCGYYGTWGIPFYFIEFDAQVDSFALPGVTPNSYQVSGGNVPSAVSSNVVNVLVVASFGQEVEKQLSTDGGTNFASSGTAAPGSNARFRLNYKNTSNVPVTSVQMIDLLGRDDGTNDWTIFNRTLPRGSQFDVSYIGNHATSLLPLAPPPSPTLSWATGQNICLPPYVASGCNPTTWGAVPDRNIRAEYGSLFNLAPNTNLLEDFDVGIPLTALNGQKVCNDFAAIATANFLLNGSPQAVALTPVASPVICLTIDTTHVSVSCCDSIKVERAQGGNGVIGCCARFTATCPVDSIKITVSNGTLASINWNCGTLPAGFIGQSSVTLAAGGCIPDITTCVDPATNGIVSISYQVVFSNGEKCEKRIELDCTAAEPKCCDEVKLERVVDAAGTDACCARLTTECEVKSIDISIHNGTFSSASWNCGTLPTGFVGQSSFTFNANNCVLDMVTCVTPDSTGLVVISYVINFTNGEKCEKRIELDCKVEEPKCCDNVKLHKEQNSDGTDACCARLTTECEVKSIDISIHNGTFSSASWNCGTLPTGFVGQSSFTFNANNCAVDMVTCVTPDSTGVVVISYIIHFTNGEVCEKRIELDCKKEPKCCDNVKLQKEQNSDGTDACCARLTTECEVKSIDVSIHNGTFSNVSWNCGTLPTGFVGQSSFTFNANNCAVDMVTCVTPDSTGVVVISYIIHFTNGEVCEKRIELDCKIPPPETCCALANFKLKSKWPFWKTQVGTFNIINADPSVPICYIEISPSPAGSFTTGSLIVDGVTSAQSWNTTRIPASGNLTPSAVNTVDFSLVSNNYSGTVTICVVKCDGTRCCFEFKWNKPVIGHVDLSLDKAELSTGLKAVRISPVVSTDLPNKIKYVSFGLSSEEEVTGNASQFFAISASAHEGDDYPAGLASTISASMGKSNAFFELSQAKGAGEAMGYFNLVFAGKLPKLGCTLFDEEGSILYDGEVNLAGSDTVITSLNLNASASAGNMFDLIKVFPNPSDGVFTVTYTTGTPRDVEMRIVTSTGLTVDSKVIEDRTAGVHNLNIRTSGLVSGMYMVILVSEGETRSKPLIIK